MTSVRNFDRSAPRRSNDHWIERSQAQDLQRIEGKPVRAIKTIAFGALLAAAALACMLVAQPAQAQVPICHWPSSVPAELLASITARVAYTPSPGADICDAMAKAEVKGCRKAVQNSASCNDVLNETYAQAAEADCATLPDSASQKACSSSVQAELDAATQTVRDAAASGQQTCVDLTATVVASCLAGTL